MLCKNFQPDTSQNDAAANFGACSEQQAKTVAKHSANDTTGEGNQTDKGRGGNAVSYTHLDVYKRQILRSFIRRPIGVSDLSTPKN